MSDARETLLTTLARIETHLGQVRQIMVGLDTMHGETQERLETVLGKYTDVLSRMPPSRTRESLAATYQERLTEHAALARNS